MKTQSSGEYLLPGSESYIRWHKNLENGFQKVELYLFRKGRYVYEIITSPHAVELVFFAGWFECKVAKILSSWRHAKNIYMNCHFPFKQGVDKNEVDIVVDTGTKILFVECKTQIHAPTDIDKFRSVVKGYGGMASKGLFVTDSKMSDVAFAKCREHSLLNFSLKDCNDDEIAAKSLISMLDKELYNINAR